MRKRILTLGMFALLAVMLVCVLFRAATATSRGDAGFTRQVRSHLLTVVASLDLQRNAWYVSGNDKNNFYLSNFHFPNLAFRSDFNLRDTQWLQLSIDSTVKVQLSAVNIAFLDDAYYVLNGGDSNIYSGKITGSNANEIKKTVSHFDYGLPLTNDKFVFRSYSNEAKQNILIQQSASTQKSFFLEREEEGVFSTSGMLHLAPDRSKLFYIYTYKNRITCLDSNLRVLYNQTTIDTNRRAKLHIDSIKSEKRITFSQPPTKVNKSSAISDRYVFICSMLRATNEDKRKFDAASVIDIYNSSDGTYRFSFYVPDYRGKKLSCFAVADNRLLVVHDSYLVVYEFLNGLT